jgi:CSLREA domain-containing protein
MRRPLLALALAALLALALPASAEAIATFTVTETTDAADANLADAFCDVGGGVCTLRAAIQEANDTPNSGTFGEADQIHFSIGASGSTQTISPATALPTITERLVVDGSTQPGYAGVPLITVSGTGTSPASPDGFVFGSGSGASALDALALVNHRAAIKTTGTGTASITRSYIGIAQDGTASALTDNLIGVEIGPECCTNLGELPREDGMGNVISNNATGIVDTAGGGGQIYGNFVGTNPAGTAALGNTGDGMNTDGITTIIGNVFSGNGDDGIDATGAAFISFNNIGTNDAGTAAVPNGGAGVELKDTVNEFNGNVISGNAGGGIRMVAGGGTRIKGSLIGVGADGTTPIPNLGFGGIDIATADNYVGGALPDEPNTIANNQPFGVRVVGASGNELRGNVFLANDGLAIDLGGDGVTQNDAAPDGDSGANGLQNFPVISSAVTGAGGAQVSGSLASTASRAFDVQLYASPTCDPSGFGEGATLLQTVLVTTGPSGNASFGPVTVPATAAQGITATATDNVDENTSEFSSCVVVTSPGGGGGGGGGGGSTVQAFGADTLISLHLAAKAIKAKGPVKVVVQNGNAFQVQGTLSGETTKKIAGAAAKRKKKVKLKAKAFTVAASGKVTVALKLPKKLRGVLKHKGKLSLALTALVRDPAGDQRTVKKTLKPKLKKKKKKKR